MTIPPLHPIFVHLPLALIPVSVAADCFGLGGNQPLARVFGRWSLLAAWVAMIPTTYFGYFDYGRLSENEVIESLVRLHSKMGWALFLCLTLLGIWRASIHFRKTSGRAGNLGYLACAWLVFGLTVFQGWYGGELVYGVGASVYSPDKKLPPHGESPATIYRVHAAFSHLPLFRDRPEPVSARDTLSESAKKK